MKKLATLLILFVATAAHARLDHAGIVLEISENWAKQVTERSTYPVRYRLTNNSRPQTVEVRFDSGNLTLRRSHRLAAGETVNGCLYFPMSNRPYTSHYGRISIAGSVSGSHPPNESESISLNRNNAGEPVPAVLLVGQGFDITGLNESLENLGAGPRRGYGTQPEQFYGRISAADIPASWIGLSGVSVVLITQAEAERLSTESKSALQDYVFSGGYVVIVSWDKGWCAQWWGNNGATDVVNDLFVAHHGLGSIRQERQSPTRRAEWDEFFQNLATLGSTHSKTVFLRRFGSRLPAWGKIMEQMDVLPLELPEFTRVSYMGLWWLMVGFAVLVGPVNYGWLRKRGKLHLFIVTAPVISLASGTMILGAFSLLEGFHSRSVVSGITFLFQKDHRALSFHRASVYSTTALPLQYPSDTLVVDRFGSEFQSTGNEETKGTIDLTEGYRLTGYVPPRLIRAFGSARIKTERGRLVMENRDGKWQAQNGLGVDVREFLYRDATGSYYEGGYARSGETVTLKPIKNTEATALQQRLTKFGGESTMPSNFTLPPSAYIAETVGVFGWETPNKRLETKTSRHILYGFIGHE